MSAIEEHSIDTEQRFLSRWPFFGTWFIALVDLAEERGVQLENLSVLRAYYLNLLEPTQALSNLTRGHQS